MLNLSSNSLLREWKFWLITGIFTPIIISLVIVIHDTSIDVDKAHSNWYNAWKNDITHETHCQNLNNLIEDEQGKWIHSELYPLVEKRLGELHCP